MQDGAQTGTLRIRLNEVHITKELKAFVPNECNIVFTFEGQEVKCSLSVSKLESEPLVSWNNILYFNNVPYPSTSQLIINICDPSGSKLVVLGDAVAGYNLWTIGSDVSEEERLAMTTENGKKVGEINLYINWIQNELGRLKIRLNKARNLAGPELLKLNDCYIVFTLQNKSVESSVKYYTDENNKEVVWEEDYYLDNVPFPPESKLAIMAVYKGNNKDIVLGIAEPWINLWSIGTEAPNNKWMAFVTKDHHPRYYAGEIYLNIQWIKNKPIGSILLCAGLFL